MRLMEHLKMVRHARKDQQARGVLGIYGIQHNLPVFYDPLIS
jgi:hypothetical protein